MKYLDISHYVHITKHEKELGREDDVSGGEWRILWVWTPEQPAVQGTEAGTEGDIARGLCQRSWASHDALIELSYEYELPEFQMGKDSLEGVSEVSLNVWDGERYRNLCGGMNVKTQLEEGHLGFSFCE